MERMARRILTSRDDDWALARALIYRICMAHRVNEQAKSPTFYGPIVVTIRLLYHNGFLARSKLIIQGSCAAVKTPVFAPPHRPLVNRCSLNLNPKRRGHRLCGTFAECLQGTGSATK
jgi:hypothetical protein